MPKAQKKSLHTVQGGGTRSEKAPPFHLVPREGFRRTAQRFGLGAEHHGPWNWMQSIQTEEDAYAWCVEAYNHMMEHALKMVSGDCPDDDHLGAIGWAQSVLAHCEAKYKKLWTSLNGNLPMSMRGSE